MSQRIARTARRISAALVGAALFVALVGCGIPDETNVQVDGRGPDPGTGSVDGTGLNPPGRTDAGDEVGQFVVNFLRAAAGEPSGAYDRVNAYLPAERRHRAKPVNEVAINIIRLTEERPRFTDSASGPSLVTIRVSHVGVLRANGSIGEPTLTDTEYEFTVGRIESDRGKAGSDVGLYVLDPPPVLLLSADALQLYYRERMIYFWNADRTALVPDLRYLPRAVPTRRQPTELLSWLTGGPADWLVGTAVRLPEGSAPIGNVPAADSGGRMEINLSVKAGELDNETELEQLFTQIAWSMGENLRGELELKIQGQQRKVADVRDYLAQHPLYRVTGTPGRYCVYDSEIHPLGEPDTANEVPIAADANRDIRFAALARDSGKVWAALVTSAGDRWRLRTGSGPGTVINFADGTETYGAMGRPVWLKGSDPRDPIGLVVADGRLYRFGMDAVLREVVLPNVAGSVTSVGAALDGHRIAVVAGGGIYVASLAVEGDTVTAGRARRLATTPRDISVVEWSGEGTLVLSGVNPEGWVAVYQTTIDGALERELINRVQLPRVTHLTAYPDNPVVRSPGGSPMYEGNGVAYSAGERITLEQVAGGTQSRPAGAGNPIAPFFLY
jgi:hypothetical protein